MVVERSRSRRHPRGRRDSRKRGCSGLGRLGFDRCSGSRSLGGSSRSSGRRRSRLDRELALLCTNWIEEKVGPQQVRSKIWVSLESEVLKLVMVVSRHIMIVSRLIARRRIASMSYAQSSQRALMRQRDELSKSSGSLGGYGATEHVYLRSAGAFASTGAVASGAAATGASGTAASAGFGSAGLTSSVVAAGFGASAVAATGAASAAGAAGVVSVGFAASAGGATAGVGSVAVGVASAGLSSFFSFFLRLKMPLKIFFTVAAASGAVAFVLALHCFCELEGDAGSCGGAESEARAVIALGLQREV